jgi:spore coat polysaccharide biosynthesis predicted glycosyltransferase SpsG
MQPLLILRVHTDLRLGLGHVTRALAIQEAWAALGGQCCLAVSGDARARRVGAGLHPFSDQNLPCEAVDLGEEISAGIPEALKSRAAVVLVDLWDTTPAQIKALRPLKVAVMEDDGDAHEHADLLFQPYLEGVSWPAGPLKSVNGRKVRPCETSHGACRVLRGLDFGVVSPVAGQLRPRREPLQPLSAQKLLATFGGTDGPGLVQRAFEVLRDLRSRSKWAGTCTLLAPSGVQGSSIPGCTVISHLPALTRRLQDYDAIWCAMGVTLAEALCVGVPVAAWGQNERQARMIGDLALSNACYSLGTGTEADPRAVADALAHWLSPEGQESRQEQVRDGMALIDGMGASRVAQELWSLSQDGLSREIHS